MWKYLELLCLALRIPSVSATEGAADCNFLFGFVIPVHLAKIGFFNSFSQKQCFLVPKFYEQFRTVHLLVFQTRMTGSPEFLTGLILEMAPLLQAELSLKLKTLCSKNSKKVFASFSRTFHKKLRFKLLICLVTPITKFSLGFHKHAHPINVFGAKISVRTLLFAEISKNSCQLPMFFLQFNLFKQRCFGN